MGHRPATTTMALQRTVEEIVTKRNNAVKLYEDGHKLICMAMSESALIDNRSLIYIRGMETPEKIKKDIDKATWRYVFKISGMEMLMNAKQKAEFENQIDKDAPEVTVETVKSTLFTQFSCKDQTFLDGMINTFSFLDKKYKSNKAFKFNKKVVFNGVSCRSGFWTYYDNNPQEMLIDLERIIYIINERRPPTRSEGISSKLYDHLATASVVEMDYMRCKTFKNGNVHLEITCAGTLNKINDLIAEYYGGGLFHAS